jgi:hypothetical protein
MKRRLILRHIRYLLAIDEHRNFTRAADALFTCRNQRCLKKYDNSKMISVGSFSIAAARWYVSPISEARISSMRVVHSVTWRRDNARCMMCRICHVDSYG